MDYISKLILIEQIINLFEIKLSNTLNLIKVQAPLFLKKEDNLQDYLTGSEVPVSFDSNCESFEIVQSLAKWKRHNLTKWQFPVYSGIITNMKAIRKDENVDLLHSILVDQWDFEIVIQKKDRNIDFFKEIVKQIYSVIVKTKSVLFEQSLFDDFYLPDDIFFITSQELENLFPNDSPLIREELITLNKKAVCILQIGDKLKSGLIHDLRSPDYDDWSLNGDILIYHKKLKCAIEIASLGIRVDKKALAYQLDKCKLVHKINEPYYKEIFHDTYLQTLGGGIGMSRLLMLFLQTKHIAEVQLSSWPRMYNKINIL